jgi:hypothetical protein
VKSTHYPRIDVADSARIEIKAYTEAEMEEMPGQEYYLYLAGIEEFCMGRLSYFAKAYVASRATYDTVADADTPNPRIWIVGQQAL